MRKDFYFIVLKYLAKNGLYRSTDISQITQEYLSDQKNAKDVIWLSVKDNINLLFEDMQKSGHIKGYINKTDSNAVFDSNFKYLDYISISAEITPTGYSFYKEHNRNYWTRVISVIALLIAAISAAFNYA